MPTERLMGIENEFAFTAIDRTGKVADRQSLLETIDDIAERLFVSLPCLSGSGIFLENGARLYLDCGAHLEYCTPECTTPWDVVRFCRAGERILLKLSNELARRRRLRSATFYRCNVDYTGTGSSWGTHDSYMHYHDDGKRLAADMIPHFVSRLIFTGAGGWNSLSAVGCVPTLSPRAHHFRSPISSDSTRDRGIFHTKDESLAGANEHRLHIILGESLCSDLASWLKVATTALVVAMAEAKISPGNDVALDSPVDTLHAFANDFIGKTAAARTTGGGSVTALDIQRHYLALAQMNVHADWMPSWAATAIEQWDAMLRRIEAGPDAVATTLDWAIKRQVFAAHLRKRGFTWEKLDHWSHLAGLLTNALSGLRPPIPASALSAAFVRNARGPLAPMVEQLRDYLAARQLQWDDLDAYLKLRVELFELDTRFGILGDCGIFNLLDKAGALQHGVTGVANIDEAITHPPSAGRARFRSAAIRECHSRRGEFGCDWDCIHHFDTDRFLDMSNPWTEHAEWSEEPRVSPRPAASERMSALHRMLALRDARRRLDTERTVRPEDIQF